MKGWTRESRMVGNELVGNEPAQCFRERLYSTTCRSRSSPEVLQPTPPRRIPPGGPKSTGDWHRRRWDPQHAEDVAWARPGAEEVPPSLPERRPPHEP